MIFLILTSLIWAFSFGLVKNYLGGIDSSLAAFIRLFLSFVLFSPFLFVSLKKNRKNGGLRLDYILKMLLIGAIQCGFMYLFYFKAFAYLKAYEMALLTVSTPLLVTFIFDAFKRKFHFSHLLMALMAILGTLIILYRPGQNIEIKLLGFLYAELSNASFAIGQVLYRLWNEEKGEEKWSDAKLFPWLYLGSLLPLLFICPFSKFKDLVLLTPTQWAVLIYLGLVASGLGIYFWNRGAKEISSVGILAVMNNLKIPLALIVSVLFFKEEIYWPSLALGTSFIFLGLLMGRILINLKYGWTKKFRHRNCSF